MPGQNKNSVQMNPAMKGQSLVSIWRLKNSFVVDSGCIEAIAASAIFDLFPAHGGLADSLGIAFGEGSALLAVAETAPVAFILGLGDLLLGHDLGGQ